MLSPVHLLLILIPAVGGAIIAAAPSLLPQMVLARRPKLFASAGLALTIVSVVACAAVEVSLIRDSSKFTGAAVAALFKSKKQNELLRLKYEWNPNEGVAAALGVGSFGEAEQSEWRHKRMTQLEADIVDEERELMRIRAQTR